MVRVRKYVPLATNPPHHLQNLISSTHYPTLHPYPLLFRLLSPFSPLCYEQVRAAGHRRWAAKADPPPPPTLRSDSGGSEQLAVGIASTARVSAIFIFLDIFAEIIFTWVGLGDSVKISFSHADALPARENDNLCGHLDADGTKVCM